ncbi:nicotinamide-nucleotide adenylyltransferase [Candidatus Woesearchaeota archaeon]|nr:nicotinamide-nucleotide adenylyltransferase [Candidatus Woesearchaeota archaeon]
MNEEKVKNGEKKKKIGLFIGRFQPFHNGHLKAIKLILSKVDLLYIGIGSAQESKTQVNPYTVSQRATIIRAALAAVNIKNYILFSIRDVAQDAVWIRKIAKRVGKNTHVYSGNPHTLRVFHRGGYKTTPLSLYSNISATKVRRLMKQGQNWKNLVPRSTWSFHEEFQRRDNTNRRS